MHICRSVEERLSNSLLFISSLEVQGIYGTTIRGRREQRLACGRRRHYSMSNEWNGMKWNGIQFRL
jgi:hypothetical protein